MKTIPLSLVAVFLMIACASTAPKSSEKSSQTKAILADIQSIDESLEKVSIPDSEKANLLVEKAKKLLQMKSYNEATAVLKQALQLKNGNRIPHVNHYLGSAYFGKSEFGSAISHFQKSENEDKDFEAQERRKMWAKAYFEESKYGPALAVLGKASKDKAFDKDQLYYETAAQSFFKIKEFKKGLMILQEGLMKFPESESLLKLKDVYVEAIESKS